MFSCSLKNQEFASVKMKFTKMFARGGFTLAEALRQNPDVAQYFRDHTGDAITDDDKARKHGAVKRLTRTMEMHRANKAEKGKASNTSFLQKKSLPVFLFI